MVLLAERLHIDVFTLEQMPADRVLFYRNMFYIEGEISHATAGLRSDEPLLLLGDD